MQKDQFDITKASVPPLLAERRFDKTRDADEQIRSVEANSRGLVRATLGSAAVAGAILTLFWLPAEYGIDATGLGRVMGLTQMGEIKQQLYAEAEADDAVLVAQSDLVPPGLGRTELQIDDRLAAIAAIVGVVSAPAGQTPTPEVTPSQSAPKTIETVAVAPEPDQSATPIWRDEVSYTLAPTEGIEVKLVMEEGAVATFKWTANGGVLNYDTHADGSGQNISYEQGRAVPGQEGELVAAFTGNHGWFWRNRTGSPVTITLQTRGDYAEMKAP